MNILFDIILFVLVLVLYFYTEAKFIAYVLYKYINSSLEEQKEIKEMVEEMLNINKNS